MNGRDEAQDPPPVDQLMAEVRNRARQGLGRPVNRVYDGEGFELLAGRRRENWDPRRVDEAFRLAERAARLWAARSGGCHGEGPTDASDELPRSVEPDPPR